MAKASPSPTASDGRDPAGRFTRGNAFSRGNPHSRRVGELRSALLDAVQPADVRAMVEALVRKARSGDVLAIRVVLDRVFGRVADLDAAAAAEQAAVDGLRRVAEHRRADADANRTPERRAADAADSALVDAARRYARNVQAEAFGIRLPPD